jgi:hypothetical protein
LWRNVGVVLDCAVAFHNANYIRESFPVGPGQR